VWNAIYVTYCHVVPEKYFLFSSCISGWVLPLFNYFTNTVMSEYDGRMKRPGIVHPVECRAGWWRQLQTQQTLALAFPGTEWWGANIWNMESRVPSPLITCPCFYSLAFISSAYHLLPSLGCPTRASLSTYVIVIIIYKPSSSFSSAPFLFPLFTGFLNLFSL